MNSEWVFDPIVWTPYIPFDERQIHLGLLDFFAREYPHATIETEANWPVGRPDIVLTTQITPGFRSVAIIELKRDRANAATVQQVSRYYWYRVSLAKKEPGYTLVVAIVAAPWLSPAVELSPWLMYLPIRTAEPAAPE